MELASTVGPSAALLHEGPGLYRLGSCAVHVVSTHQELQPALDSLRTSLAAAADSHVGLDLEWRPEHQSGKGRPNKVALLQLGSAGVVVLVRTCRVPFCPALQALLSDPGVTLVGFGWAGADEQKMRASFGWGWAQFGAFKDLQVLAHSLGYRQHGIAKLAQSVLGIAVEKDRKVATSNWEARELSPEQIKYAACDVLFNYYAHRQLRQWQQLGPAQAPACEECGRRLGVAISPRWKCLSCGMCFLHLGVMEGHALKVKHDTGLGHCGACGRVQVREADPQLLPGAGEPCWGSDPLLAQQELAAGVRFEVQQQHEEAGQGWGTGAQQGWQWDEGAGRAWQGSTWGKASTYHADRLG